MKDYNHGNFNGVPYTMHCFIEMQFAAHFYTVIPYQALFRLPVYKNSAVGRSGAIFLLFCKIRDFGSPTIKVIVLNTGIFWLLRTCSASFDHLIGEKTRMYFAKSLSDSIMNSYSLLPNITILIMQSTSMALQRI